MHKEKPSTEAAAAAVADIQTKVGLKRMLHMRKSFVRVYGILGVDSYPPKEIKSWIETVLLYTYQYAL